MSRIDRVRHAAQIERSARSDERPEEAPEGKVVQLPALVPARQPRDPGANGAAAFAAQLVGQDGQKRGLRAGPAHIEAARGAYNRVEWSGSKDRRARVGRNAKTEV